MIMVTVNFPGRFKSLAGIRKFVKQAARKAGFMDSEIYAVELAVDEACSNIIEHAYGAENVGQITASFEVNSQEFRLTLRDDGRPFDPDTVPEPKLLHDKEDSKGFNSDTMF